MSIAIVLLMLACVTAPIVIGGWAVSSLRPPTDWNKATAELIEGKPDRQAFVDALPTALFNRIDRFMALMEYTTTTDHERRKRVLASAYEAAAKAGNE